MTCSFLLSKILGFEAVLRLFCDNPLFISLHCYDVGKHILTRIVPVRVSTTDRSSDLRTIHYCITVCTVQQNKHTVLRLFTKKQGRCARITHRQFRQYDVHLFTLELLEHLHQCCSFLFALFARSEMIPQLFCERKSWFDNKFVLDKSKMKI